MTKKKKTEDTCSFCGRTADQAGMLIAGMDALICNECVDHAKIYLEEIQVKEQKNNIPDKFPTPKEIKDELDKYVFGQ
ncbi:MAG: ATP-dependent Clp protease ATP-binding subunit ClpX, partial [Candidatus Delongbacteria bacterium]|nr:ATP-dependent Clp protease ATP-binding subunit ClpX [Candidatus Delongbacteria bacterium]